MQGLINSQGMDIIFALQIFVSSSDIYHHYEKGNLCQRHTKMNSMHTYCTFSITYQLGLGGKTDSTS